MFAFSVARPFIRIALVLITFFVVSARAEIAVNITYADSPGEGFFDPSPRTALAGNAGTTLGEQRRNAFETAVYHWSKLLNGTVTLRVRANWVSQGTETLASATPLGFVSDWSGVPVAGRYYPAALANQLAGLDHDPAEDDILVMCNPDWDDGSNAGTGDSRKWYYGTDGNPPSGDFDFFSTMLHELGHGLGFLSFLNTDGTWQNGAPTIYDNFLATGSGNWVSSLSQSQRAATVTSANLFSAGSTTTSVNYDQWARIYAPTTFDGGSSLSHLDEATFSTTGNIDECMTPISSFATHSIGPVATALFRDMGYSFVDNKAPTVAITLPANGSSRSGLTLASGTATDTSSAGDAGATGLREVRVTLARNSDGRWYNWLADTWGSTTYDPVANIKKAGASIVPISKGERSWAIALPTLADGSYEIQVQAVDQMNLGSTWVKSTFTMDRSAPSISFDPLQTNDVVFNFAEIGGFANDATSVSYAIYDITDSPSRFWNGSGWSTFGVAYLPGTISNGRWAPADPAQLPPRSQIRLGTYTLYAKAYDAASNSITSTITVTRSAADTTLPDAEITSPSTNQIITTQVLPTLSGTASDPQSGIANISVYLLRVADSGFLYWDGSAWTESVSSIAVSHDVAGNSWQSSGTLPSGSNLPNGTYQLQVSVQNGENPPGTRGISSLFVVDYHPTYTWTEGSYRDGVVGNDNQEFTNPANWNPYGVPPADALVVINSGTCNASSAGSLSLWGVNVGSSGTLTTPGLFVKKLNVSGGTLNGGAVNVDGDNGVFNWTGGQVNGTLTILSGAVANVSGSGTKTLGTAAVLNNSGTINWSGSGSLYALAYNLADRATINNLSNAVFNLQNDGNVFSSSYNRSIFNNADGARFIKTGGIGNLAANGFDFNNAGEIRSEVGTIAFSTILNASAGTQFTGAGNFLFESGTASFAGNVLIDGPYFKMESGTLNGADLVLTSTNGGLFEWSGGTIQGTLEIAPNTSFNISGSSTKTIGSTSVIRNRGAIVWSGSGTVYAYAYNSSDRATFLNMIGASFSISSTGRFSYSYTPSIFSNEHGATLTKSGAGSSGFDWVFNNDGDVRCQGGTLFFNSGGSSGGSFTADAGATINFGGGVQTLNDGAELFGAGTFQIQSGTVRRNGVLSVGGSATSTLELLSGTFDGNGALDGTATFNWSGGTIAGQLDLGTNIIANVTSSSEKTIASESIINNGGTFNWGGSGNLYASAYALTNRATFNNLSNAVFTISSNAAFSSSYNPSIFNNHEGATLTKTAGSGTTRFDWIFNSMGTVRCSVGTLSFAQGGNGGGSFTADTNAIIQFSGGVHTLTNATVLDGAGKIQITSGTVHHLGDIQTGTADVPATLELFYGAAFKGSGALNGVCTVNWNGGRIGDGRLDVAPTVTFNASGSSDKELASDTIFNNAGTFNWFGGGAIYCMAYNLTNRSSFNNLPGAVFNLRADGWAFSVSYNASLFTNQAGALLVKSGGLGSTTLSAFDFVNFGELRVETGTVVFGSKLNLNPPSVFTGSGTVKFTGTTTLATDLNSSCQVILESGSFTGLKNALPAPTFTGLGTFNWTGGSISGALTINSNVTFAVSSSSEKYLSEQTVVDNYGTVNWTGTGNLYVSAYQPTNAAVVFNRSGATWNWGSDAGFTYSYSPSIFNNEAGAVFRKSGGTGTAYFGWTFNNQGSLFVDSGKLGLEGASSMASSAATTLSLGGTVAGTGYAQLVRSGTLSLGGSLNVVLKNGFMPTNGSSFNLVTYSSRNGEFGSVVLPTLPAASTWKVSYGASALVAQVVPVPLLGNAAKLGDGSFEISVTGESASSAVIEASTDLIQWMPISTNAPFTGVWNFVDPQASNFTNRFYRLVIIP